jgi:hypothetical protein
MTDPQKDDHIEELLGKLQGIFGKLSHSEEEEAKLTIEVPSAAPKEPPIKETPAPEPPAAKPAPPAPINMYAEPPPAQTSSPAASIPPPAPIVLVSVTPGPGAYASTVSLGDPDRVIVPTAIYFPPGREAEGKSLAQKLETMTPKFTKVAFRLRVEVFLPYDPKSDWKDSIIAKSAEIKFQTAFVVMDRPMDDIKRKAVAAELEGRNIYFQEVTIASVEKKAFYTDILLGLVFFFDSRKPSAGAEGSAA